MMRMNNDGASYLIAHFDATLGLEMLKWVPGNVSFPLNGTTDEQLMNITLNLRQRDGQEVVDHT